jgi:hypothetical protein
LSSPNIQDILRQGVEAARSGDKLAARRLLQQVLLQDGNNEVALMWMASVVDSVDDRRAFLQKALRVNPNNQRARDALEKLGGAPVSAARATGTSASIGRQARPAPAVGAERGGNNIVLVLGALLVLAILVVLLLAAVAPQQQPVIVNPNVEQTAQAALATGIVRPSATSRPMTATPITPEGVIISLDEASVPTLPPTFTPTPSPEPTETATPTETPVPVEVYRYLASETDPDGEDTGLYAGRPGEDAVRIGDGSFGDIAVSPDGRTIAFVRMVADAPAQDAESTPPADGEATPEAAPAGVMRPQLFVASLSADGRTIGEPRQLTFYTSGSSVAYPTFSFDGIFLAFASDQDGDFDIYRVTLESGVIDQLTVNNTLDTQPAYAPDARTYLVYISDEFSPGFTDLYYNLQDPPFGYGRLYDAPGSAFMPAWSRDASQIAFIGTANVDADLFIVGSDGQRVRQLTIDDGVAEDRMPAWSPDGNYVAFASNRESDNFQWYAVNVTTLAVTRISESERNAGRLVFLE